VQDVLKIPKYPNDVMLAVLDIDPHMGIKETVVVRRLLEDGYRGILICDDIHLRREMLEGFWDGLPAGLKKIDLTEFGHFSGTGIVVFDPSYVDFSVTFKTKN
jgi:hypothetical protein